MMTVPREKMKGWGGGNFKQLCPKKQTSPIGGAVRKQARGVQNFKQLSPKKEKKNGGKHCPVSGFCKRINFSAKCDLRDKFTSQD